MSFVDENLSSGAKGPFSGRPVVVGVGEALWDEFADGRRLGGAPANVVCHARSLGADGRLVSRVGDDADGRQLLEQLRSLGVPVDAVEVDPEWPTGRVTVTVGEGGHPEYVIHEPAAWDRIEGAGSGREAAARADVICFGTLGQRSAASRRSIRALLEAAAPGAMRVLDVNLRQNYYDREMLEASLRLATAVKLNEDEVGVLAGMFGWPKEMRAALGGMLSEWNLQWAACTQGARGALLGDGRRWSEGRAPAVEVVDAVGAGDCFTAALVMGMQAGWDMDLVNERACALAAHVCTQPGATPRLPEAMCAPYLGASGQSKRPLTAMERESRP